MLESSFPEAMERAGRIIAKLAKAREHLSAQDLVFAAWPAAAGRPIAAHTRTVAFYQGKLLIEVEDDLWKRNLNAFQSQLLRNLKDLLEDVAPREIEFKVAAMRKAPRAEHHTPARSRAVGGSLFPDEADAIPDPVLRRIYVNSRRKALA